MDDRLSSLAMSRHHQDPTEERRPPPRANSLAPGHRLASPRLAVILFAWWVSAAAAVAAGNMPYRPSEFPFSQNNRAVAPDAFLRQHAVRLAWPERAERVSTLESGTKARARYEKLKSAALGEPNGRTWKTVGPTSVTDNGAWEPWEPKNSSGRVTDLAISGSCDPAQCRLFIGSAGGGLWRTDRALATGDLAWQRLSEGLSNNNIGSVTVDPNDASGRTIYVGTGESNFNYTSGAGEGVFVSTDGGDHFSRLPTWFEGQDFTRTRGVSQVAIEPGSPQTIYVTTTTAMLGMTAVRGGQSTVDGQGQSAVGVYRTTDGGATWSRLFETPVKTSSSPGTPEGIFEALSGVKDLQIDPLDPSTVYISVADDGLYRLSPTLDGDETFHRVFEIVSPLPIRTDSYAAFDLTVKDDTTRVYVYNGNGYDATYQALYRLDDANLSHRSLNNGSENSERWVNLTQPLATAQDYVDYSICNGQCVYDLVVAVPGGMPDTVYLGGQLSRNLGDPAMRSTDAGESFNGLTIDLQNPPGMPHVDVRAIVFSPNNPEIAFIGSDGGVVRTDGRWGDGSFHCRQTIGFPDGSAVNALCEVSWSEVPEAFVFMNVGLQTMQFYNISADPTAPLERQMAGTQDNSTQWNEGTLSSDEWTKVFNVGDGTSANGFHPTDPNILFASYQSDWFFTHFEGGAGGAGSWVITSWPIQDSGEATDPVGPTGRQFITFDPLAPDTQYTGFEHVWRTRSNGGDRAFLEANCRLGGNNYGPGCGDWEPLGGFLTREEFGEDRSGGVIVAAERSRADAGTLWAATSLGRVFISRNVDAPAESVSFQRLDTAATPPRFISGIAVDPANPNRAFIAYSGFSALTPDAPGHVFEVIADGSEVVFIPLDFDLGDIPINHLVRDDVTGDLFAATDFGVLTRVAGEQRWRVAGDGLPIVLTPHLEIHPEERLLFAATHGMGGWYLQLGSVEGDACLEKPGLESRTQKSGRPVCRPPPPQRLQRSEGQTREP